MLSAAALACQILLLLGPAGSDEQAAAQTAAPSQTPAQPQTPPQLPIDFFKVKKAANTPPSLNLKDNGFHFYSETVRSAPKFADMVGSFDLFNGPVPHAGMTHREFLQQTRPKELYSSAGFTPGDVIRWGLLSYVERKGFELLAKGLKEYKEARTEAERKQIRLIIERELAALRGEIIK
jgi:hypothetical protein